MKNFRHGDVILKAVKSIRGEEINKDKDLILALGEVTGHSHRIPQGQAQMFKFNDKTYIKVTKGIACLKHEEHKEIKIPRGCYEIEIQKDYSPDGWKKVQD